MPVGAMFEFNVFHMIKWTIDVRNFLFTVLSQFLHSIDRTSYLGEFVDRGAVQQIESGGLINMARHCVMRDWSCRCLSMSAFCACLRMHVYAVSCTAFDLKSLRQLACVFVCVCGVYVRACMCVCGVCVRLCVMSVCVWAAGCLAHAHWPTCPRNLSYRPAIK